MKLTIRQIFAVGVCLGVLLSCSMFVAWTDSKGLEGYIQYCRDTWVTMHWIVGASIATVVAIAILFMVWLTGLIDDYTFDKLKRGS